MPTYHNTAYHFDQDRPEPIKVTTGPTTRTGPYPIVSFGESPDGLTLFPSVNDLVRLRDSITDWLRANGHEADPESANEEFDQDYWDWLDRKYQVEGAESDGV